MKSSRNKESIQVISWLLEDKSIDKPKLKLAGDFTIADIIHITGCAKDNAYSRRYHGEYFMGRRRLVRREVFLYRRSQGLNICKED